MYVMKNTYVGYISKNGIRFHHSRSVFDAEYEKETLALEAHHMCEIFLLLSGSVQYIIEGKSYQISPMEMLIVAPGELHTLQMDTSQPYERMVLHFAPDLLPSLNDLDLFRPFHNAKTFTRIIPRRHVEKYDLFARMNLFKKICTEKGKYVDLNLVSAIIKITKTLNDMLDDIAKENDFKDDVSLTNTTISSLCIQYIHQHVTEHLSAENVAKALNISASHLQHTFKKEMGVNLRYYVLRQKMYLAQRMLAQGEAAQSVAAALGYECYSTFYHNYVKCFHRTPIDLKNINRSFFGKEIDNTDT